MVLIAPNSHRLYFEFGSGVLFLETPFTQVVVGKNTLSLWLEILREKKYSRIYTAWFDLTITKRKFTTVPRFLQKSSPCFQKSISVKATEQALLLCCVSLCGWTYTFGSPNWKCFGKGQILTVQILIFFVFENV